MAKRRTVAEWRQILEEQREQGLSDRSCCARHGTHPMTLKRWRGRLGSGGTRESSQFVEFLVSKPAGEMRIILPNRVELVVGPEWGVDHVAEVAARLASL